MIQQANQHYSKQIEQTKQLVIQQAIQHYSKQIEPNS